MKKKKPMFRVKKQKLPRSRAIFKPEPSSWQEVAPITASLRIEGVADPASFCERLGVVPYQITPSAVVLAYTDLPQADANGMLHTLLDPLLAKTPVLCRLQAELGAAVHLQLSFGAAEPPALLILDGALCNFILDTHAIREPDFSIF